MNIVSEEKNYYFNEKHQVGVDYNIAEEVDKWEQFSETRSVVNDLAKLNLCNDNIFLDLGCGLGFHVKHALSICKFSYGLDCSLEMISRAEKNLGSCKNYKLLHKGFLEVDSIDFVRKPNKIYSWGALHHLPDFWKYVALSKIVEASSKDCLFVLADTCWCFKPGKYSEYLEGFIESVDESHGRKIANQLMKNIKEEFTTFDFVMEKLIKEAGFRVIDKSVAETRCFVEYLLCK